MNRHVLATRVEWASAPNNGSRPKQKEGKGATKKKRKIALSPPKKKTFSPYDRIDKRSHTYLSLMTRFSNTNSAFMYSHVATAGGPPPTQRKGKGTS